MKKKPGCLTNFLAVALLLGLAIWGIEGCYERSRQAERAEQSRRAALTPERREAEDHQAAEEKARAEDEAELSAWRSRAKEAARGYVRQCIKHPDDATFGGGFDTKITQNAARDTFFVSSTVKAKNSFGATLTYRWGTIVFYDGDNWKLVSCVIDDKTVYDDKALYARLKNRK